MDERRRKLRFRAWRRGFRELDLLMGSFADLHLETFSEDEVDEFERLLEVSDWEIYGWLTETNEIPDHQRGPVLDRMCKFRYAAQPG